MNEALSSRDSAIANIEWSLNKAVGELKNWMIDRISDVEKSVNIVARSPTRHLQNPKLTSSRQSMPRMDSMSALSNYKS